MFNVHSIISILPNLGDVKYWSLVNRRVNEKYNAVTIVRIIIVDKIYL